MGEHRGDRAAVLALEAVEQRQALLDLVQPAGRRIDALGVAVQLVHAGPRPRARARGRGRPARRAPRPRRATASSACAAAASASDAPPPSSSPPASAPTPRGGRQRSASTWRSRLALGLERGLLLLARLGAVDLRQLPLEQVQLAVARAGALAQLGEARDQRPLARRRRRGSASRRAGLVRPGEAVEDLELGRREHQLAVLVLAVERQQRGARVAQIGRRRAAPAEVGARAALGAHPAREHELLGVLGQPVARAPRAARPAARRRPPRRPPPRRGARCPDRGLPPSSRSSACASTVLPAPVSPVSTFKPGPRQQLGPLDQQEVLDAQFVEHAQGSTSGARRIGAGVAFRRRFVAASAQCSAQSCASRLLPGE